MKKAIKTVAFSAVVIMGLSVSAIAQKAPAKDVKSAKKATSELNLSDAQKAQLKANHEQAKANRDKFKSSLTAEQKKIVENKTLDRKTKAKQLQATLSPEQRAAQKANLEQAKKNHQAFHASLTAEQKAKADSLKGKRMAHKGAKKSPKKG
ncbi:Spy/CpxP family protein refolding chaperone [Pelobium manganitolerans]|uniref:Spy/CpxP family protein refolding chaperone n=1 Tax=Pelobium manganitolerans TaxID=1842495 RepID=UPI003FA38A9C